MKRFSVLLLSWLAASAGHAQSLAQPAAGATVGELQPVLKSVFLPLFGLYLLCHFVLMAVRMLLNYLLKRQMVATATTASVVERLVPGPQDERNSVVRWIALLTSTGCGLTICSWYQLWNINGLIVLIFSTAIGFAAYYLYPLRQPK